MNQTDIIFWIMMTIWGLVVTGLSIHLIIIEGLI